MSAMQQIVHRPQFGRSVLRVEHVRRERAGAAVVRRASDRVEADVDALTVGQHIARWGITAVVVVLASALFALEIRATFH